MSEKYLDRRHALQLSGTALVAAIAGCSVGNGEDGGDSPTTLTTAEGDDEPTMTPAGGDGEATTTTGSGETTPTSGDGETKTGEGASGEQVIDDYLTSDPAAGNYDGSIIDETGTDEVVVQVGAEGNDGDYAFKPVAIRISAGTTIRWEWTGEGGQHNVVSDENSDSDFKSGEPKTSGDPFKQAFDETGVGLYYCSPHQSLGMKGAFEVVD